jgi:hypothetical protein
MAVGDDQLHAAQAAPSELAQEGGPEGLGFGSADLHAEHFGKRTFIVSDKRSLSGHRC